MPTFGLIHGAWHGAWCWDPLAADDEFFTPESRRWAARIVFGIEPIEIEGGHFPMLERPAELADILVANLG